MRVHLKKARHNHMCLYVEKKTPRTVHRTRSQNLYTTLDVKNTLTPAKTRPYSKRYEELV